MEVMKNCGKLLFIKLIPLVLFCCNLTSCEIKEKVTYHINWILLSNKDVKIQISFMDMDDYTKDYFFDLIPGETEKIVVAKGVKFMEYGLIDNSPTDENYSYMDNVQFYIHNRPGIASIDAEMEIYIYDPIVEFYNGRYIMEEKKDIKAYFVKY
jgi:hypothetical protein